MKATEFLRAGAQRMEDRAREYDKPEGERSMKATVEAFNAITGRDLNESEGWLLLEVLKNVRLFGATGFHRDSAEDGIAYAGLKSEALEAERETPGRDLVEGTGAAQPTRGVMIAVEVAPGGGAGGKLPAIPSLEDSICTCDRCVMRRAREASDARAAERRAAGERCATCRALSGFGCLRADCSFLKGGAGDGFAGVGAGN